MPGRLPFLLIFVALSAFGACHVITPAGAGSKSGADWNNACAGFSGSCAAGSLTRGDSYYLAGGSGSSYNTSSGVTFNTPSSGTAIITIKGATAADNCTATGWTSGLDVSTTQATFRSASTFSGGNFGGNALWGFTTPYWTVEGNTCGTSANHVYESGGQGIFLDNSAWQSTTASMGAELSLGQRPNYDATHDITFHCMDIRGAGVSSTSGNSHSISSISCSGGVATVSANQHQFGDLAQVAISGNSAFNTSHAVISRTSQNAFTFPATCSSSSASGGSVDGAYSTWEMGIVSYESDNLTFRQITLRESANSAVQIYGGGGNFTWDHNTLRGYAGSSVNHSEAFTFQGGAGGISNYTNVTISNSYIIDHISNGITGEIVPLYFGSITNLNVYGNVFACTNYYDNGNCNDGNGIIACINSGTVCANMYVNQNTCYGLGSAGLVYGDSSGTKHIAQMENNLGYNCPSLGVTTNGVVTTSGEDYNTTLNGSGQNSTHDFNLSGAKNPFSVPAVTIPPMLSFQLISETADADLNNGTALAAPYNIDGNGDTRGADGFWDRGAFQFLGSTTVTPPVAPTGLKVAVK